MPSLSPNTNILILRLDHQSSLPPSRRLLPIILPPLFHIAQRLFDFMHRGLITRVLTDTIADLDGRAPVGGGKFDDDVQGQGFLLVVGCEGEIIYCAISPKYQSLVLKQGSHFLKRVCEYILGVPY